MHLLDALVHARGFQWPRCRQILPGSCVLFARQRTSAAVVFRPGLHSLAHLEVDDIQHVAITPFLRRLRACCTQRIWRLLHCPRFSVCVAIDLLPPAPLLIADNMASGAFALQYHRDNVVVRFCRLPCTTQIGSFGS
jgi:hypothetical protein